MSAFYCSQHYLVSPSTRWPNSTAWKEEVALIGWRFNIAGFQVQDDAPRTRLPPGRHCHFFAKALECEPYVSHGRSLPCACTAQPVSPKFSLACFLYTHPHTHTHRSSTFHSPAFVDLSRLDIELADMRHEFRVCLASPSSAWADTIKQCHQEAGPQLLQRAERSLQLRVSTAASIACSARCMAGQKLGAPHDPPPPLPPANNQCVPPTL